MLLPPQQISRLTALLQISPAAVDRGLASPSETQVEIHLLLKNSISDFIQWAAEELVAPGYEFENL